MRITPLDIENKRFTVRWLRGFDVGEVYLFLEIVREEMEDLLRTNTEGMEKLRIAESRILQYEAMEFSLRDTVAAAQQIADEITANARKEAELTIAEGGVKASNIVEAAQERARKVEEEIVKLRGIKRNFIDDVKRLIEGTRALLGYDEVRENHERHES